MGEKLKDVLLAIKKHGYVVLGKDYWYSKSEKEVVEELMKVAGVEEIDDLPEVIEEAIDKMCKRVHGVSIDDPARWETDYGVYLYHCEVDGEKFYVVKTSYSDPESWHERYSVFKDYKEAVNEFNNEIDEIIEFLEFSADIMHWRKDIVREIEERIDWLVSEKIRPE